MAAKQSAYSALVAAPSPIHLNANTFPSPKQLCKPHLSATPRHEGVWKAMPVARRGDGMVGGNMERMVHPITKARGKNHGLITMCLYQPCRGQASY